MKWFMGVLVALAMVTPAAAQIDFWLTNDEGGAMVDEFTIDRHDGAFPVYAYVDSGDTIVDTVRMWSAFLPGIAEILDATIDVGTPTSGVIIENEAIYGAQGIGLSGAFRLATLTIDPLLSGSADWVSMPISVIPQDGVDIVGEPTMHIIPEPETALLAVLACVIGMACVGTRQRA